MGLAGDGHAALRAQPRAPLADRPRPRRVRPAAHLPAADADPLPLREREVPQRALAHAPAPGLPRGRRANRTEHRRPRAGGDRDRLVRDQGARHRGDPPGRRRPPRTTWAAGACRRTQGMERWSSALVVWSSKPTAVTFRQLHGVRPWQSSDPSSTRVWWSDAGVHQNITFPVHPDPISGMHCWHQKVRVRPAAAGRPLRGRPRRLRQVAGRSTASGSRSLGRRPTSCDGRSGCFGRSSRRSTRTASPTIDGPARRAKLWPARQARWRFTLWSTARTQPVLATVPVDVTVPLASDGLWSAAVWGLDWGDAAVVAEARPRGGPERR